MKFVTLLSGGIDSPVAAYLMANVGADVILLHMDNGEYGDPKEIDKVKSDIQITFCDDVDRLLQDDEMRPLYILAKNLEADKENVKVRTISLERDPNAVDAYKTAAVAEIESDYIIVECDKRPLSTS
jgi:diphthamide synthase (EF-2-diphthine--ammonia ligase)